MRVVVKIGSNLLTDKTGRINQRRIHYIAKEVAELHNKSLEIVIVSSGAIASGLKKLGLKSKPKEIRKKQATAAVGQPLLMWMYEKHFLKYKKHIAQILLTRDDLSNRERYVNAKNTLLTLLEMGVIPIINENDTVATDEIKFGDNDQLAALVSGLIEANHLIILSDVEGLYTSDPKKEPDAKIIKNVKEFSKEIETIAKPAFYRIWHRRNVLKSYCRKKSYFLSEFPVSIISGRKYGKPYQQLLKEKMLAHTLKPVEEKSYFQKSLGLPMQRGQRGIYYL
jgi:glutamate 5-kinase (EC 2.7.2.11)